MKSKDDATIGRFISADTIVQNFGNPQSLNRYSYCLNNPLKYTDPSGRSHVISDDGAVDIPMPMTPDERLAQAWIEFKVALNPSQRQSVEDMMDRDVFVLRWNPFNQDSVTIGDDAIHIQEVFVSKMLQGSDPTTIAVTIGHEVLGHALEGRQSDSTFEELNAYRNEYALGQTLGVDQNGSLANKLQGLDPNNEDYLQNAYTVLQPYTPVYARNPPRPINGSTPAVDFMIWAGYQTGVIPLPTSHLPHLGGHEVFE